MNDKEAVQSSGDPTNDDYSNIEDHETQHERANQNNNVYTLVEDELQSSHQLEDQNENNDLKTTNKYEGGLVMAYKNNVKNNTLNPRTFYALYIGPIDDGAGHLIFKLSTKQILTTLKYKPVHMHEDLIETINGQDSFTTNIHIDHFDSNHSTTQKDHFDNNRDDNQAQFDDTDNSELKSYDELDSSQQIDGIVRIGMTIVSTGLQGLFIQHLHKGVTTVVYSRPSLLLSIRDDILHHLYQGIYPVVSLQPSLPMSLKDNILRHLYRGFSTIISLRSPLIVSLRSEFLRSSLLTSLKSEFLRSSLPASLRSEFL